MTLDALVLIRDAVMAAHARADRAASLLGGERLPRSKQMRVELDHVDEWLARAEALLTETIDGQRNETGS